MVTVRCGYEYRKRGDVSLHCRLLEGEKWTQCAHQFHCPRTDKWELSPQAADCPIPANYNDPERRGD